MSEKTRNWFDGTINVPTLLSVIASVAWVTYYGVGLYNNLDRRLISVERANVEQSKRSDRIEGDQAQIKSDVKEQLKDIASDLKDAKEQIGQVHDQLLMGNAATRSDTRRWAR